MVQLDNNEMQIWPTGSFNITQPLIIFIFAFIVCSGIILNFYVIYRMLRLYKCDTDQFMNGTGIYLLSMAGCDTTTLLISYIQLSLTYFGLPIHSDYLIYICKASEFLIRCSYTYSMYCWLFMSGLRYLAACQPLRYSTVWRNPWTGLGPCIITTILMNLYLVTAVTGRRESCGCVMRLEPYAQLYSTVDVIVSTCIPGACILSLDLLVLCCRPQRKNSDPLLQIVFHKLDEDTEKRKMLTMRKFMMITLLAMSLSMPDGLLRGIRPFLKNDSVFVAYYIFKAAYLARFCFNAFYLSLFVFDRNLMSKTSSSRHLSVSARRLEEEPAIVPRERSRTLSCRGTSPIPVLTRNSSCILYNDVPESPGKLWV